MLIDTVRIRQAGSSLGTGSKIHFAGIEDAVPAAVDVLSFAIIEHNSRNIMEMQVCLHGRRVRSVEYEIGCAGCGCGTEDSGSR